VQRFPGGTRLVRVLAARLAASLASFTSGKLFTAGSADGVASTSLNGGIAYSKRNSSSTKLMILSRTRLQ
jgi:hypothetical protein